MVPMAMEHVKSTVLIDAALLDMAEISIPKRDRVDMTAQSRGPGRPDSGIKTKGLLPTTSTLRPVGPGFTRDCTRLVRFERV